MEHVPILVAAGLLAGAMNAIAGGGSFVTFPILILLGLPSIAANATSTVALFPGTLASTWAYRDGLTGVAGVSLKILLPISIVGGLIGALLLLLAPGSTFDTVVPWLLLLATLTFAGGRELGLALARRLRIGTATMIVCQFVLSIYGGYFGGAVGLMMLAVWSLLDTAELKTLAPARTLLVSGANGAAVLCFIVADAVRWPEMLAMLISAVLGGYGAARIAQYLSPKLIRLFVLVLSGLVTAAFFLRGF